MEPENTGGVGENQPATDLSFATFDELFAEISKRSSAVIILVEPLQNGMVRAFVAGSRPTSIPGLLHFGIHHVDRILEDYMGRPSDE